MAGTPMKKEKYIKTLEEEYVDNSRMECHWSITAILRRFSSSYEEHFVSWEYDCDVDCLGKYFHVEIFANGRCNENKGHVSIQIKIDSGLVKLSCTVSVIDASGNKRFPKSFAFDQETCTHEELVSSVEGFGLDKYIKTSTLLNDSTELLPGDSLTLCLEIEGEVYKKSKYSLNVFSVHDGVFSVLMRTEFGRNLCEISAVFRRMMESGMSEEETGCFRVPPDEIQSFKLIYRILSGDYIIGFTLTDICKLYIVADKYDMQQVIQTCHQLLISVMHAINTKEVQEDFEEDIHMISDLADKFIEDESLREVLTIYSDIKKKFEGGPGELGAFSAGESVIRWNCDISYIDSKRQMIIWKTEGDYPKKDIYK